MLIEFNFQIVLYNDMALMHTLIVDVRCTEMATSIFSGREKESWSTQLMWAFHATHEWVVNSERTAPPRANGSVCFIWQEKHYDSVYRRHSIILVRYEEMNSEHGIHDFASVYFLFMFYHNFSFHFLIYFLVHLVASSETISTLINFHNDLNHSHMDANDFRLKF